MARRKAPQNKAQPKAPENKEPFTEENKESDELTELVIRDTQLRRLLKAEQNQWTGAIGRAAFHGIAERIRAELNGKVEFEEDPHGE